MEDARPSAHAELFALETVVVGQPKRSWWRRYLGPVLAVSTVEGTPLGDVTLTDDTHCFLTTASGECVLRVEQSGPAEFRLATGTGREFGTLSTGRFVKTAQLRLRTERGRPLFLTRRGQLSAEWQLTETDPAPISAPAPTVLGRVTMSTIDAWIGLQRYLIETVPGLDGSERRTVLAAVVCLHLLRRPPGSSSAPA
ncbi:hypothetical protein ABZ307_35925 [Streptomyces griseorubiginosus]|uniref:hypothetical protein n=1 Tax=Streptomyces griseorubiginosus TaxID=67304 RepID=UPI0033B034FE